MVDEMLCRGCRFDDLTTVLVLAPVAPADLFPSATTPVAGDEAAHELVMRVCPRCSLAQLSSHDTAIEEPLGVEPQALKDQAAAAIDQLVAGGWLRPGMSVAEFRSPHGGSWSPVALERGLVEGTADSPADVVFDSFGMMHEPDQRQAVADRAARTAPGGILFLQFHSAATIVEHHQWMSLRHGHYAYYSLTALVGLLAGVGMSVVQAWEFELYGGTILIAARHGQHAGSADVTRILAAERRARIDRPDGFHGLQTAVGVMVERVRDHVDRQRARGRGCYAYGAASRAVAIFTLARLTRNDVVAVADASRGKQGRRMPGTDIPIISGGELVDRKPDSVWLTLPDLYDEIAAAFPPLAPALIVLD